MRKRLLGWSQVVVAGKWNDLRCWFLFWAVDREELRVTNRILPGGRRGFCVIFYVFFLC